ncbi:serine/threonine-protein kinase [Paractinoplanes hotanensis]|uniref:Serine/threonine protein kinase n=1 Tax=Paractinoplanes hotanensis TaxID=2906497 RepID=A0ABT0Y8A4_9ACTN|nr:serine/threonine-protein kinase [Actinoplanes hotanensis]MCM4082025.1 serine/threonine protein kinase [Actinoplanes hotanensis]
MSDEWPIAGTLLAARYRLVTLLETGGMAQIWRADDELLARPVAVKLPKGSQVVWREARMAAKLQHPNIAAVHDYREAVRADGTVAPFVVMELLAGESVAARLEREPIELPEAARIGAAVADALAAAHANGVVHRDIKPGNVMLTPTGVKILDFGISATAGEPDDDDTGSTFGTPAYVAPERLDGMPAEPATDVYGLGVLLFEMVTGDPPYPVDTWEELAEARATGPNVLPPDLPAAFRSLVDRCLADDPEMRPGAEEIRFDLTALWLKVDDPPAAEPPAASAVGGRGGVGGGAARADSRVAGPARSRPATGPGGERPADGRPGTHPDGRGGTPAGRSPRGARPTAPQQRAYAAGRAPAVTLALTPAPTRRWVLGVTVVALLAAVGGAVLAVNWPRPTNEAAPELPPPPVVVSESPAPSRTPAGTPPTTPRYSPTPKRVAPTLTFDDAVGRFRNAVEQADIRSDVALDLLNLLRPLANGDGDNVGGQVDALRRKINDRAGEGSVSPAQATLLRSRLADVNRAAGT